MAHAFSVHGISGNLGWAAAPIFLAGIASVSSWRIALFAAAFIPSGGAAVLVVTARLLQTEIAAGGVATAHQDVPPAVDLLGFMRLPAIWMCFAFFVINALALGGIQSFSSTSLRDLYGMPLAWATTGLYRLHAGVGGRAWWSAVSLPPKSDRPDRIIALALAGFRRDGAADRGRRGAGAAGDGADGRRSASAPAWPVRRATC